MDALPIISTFLLILAAELGDKTQLAIISLSSNYKASHVFSGAMLAFLAVDGISLAVGGSLLALLPMRLVLIVSGIVFIIFGMVPLLSNKEKEGVKLKKKSSTLPLFACFSLISLMELGDKTQLIMITLAAETSPILVLLGMTMAFALLTSVAVFMGAKLLSRLPLKWLKIGTSALFIIIGAFSILSAILETGLI
jgi:putative Ca2+/H+ antiporter (TMEM165/GDT1 family)